ncbi:hypothetical protein KKH46_03555, partial [Patescibacteria group bacterium]|nr:hypothetical protein [Patescibacteria group bacterium]MBU1956682.1 hypothetical protein [Patescibacteria group bacterium]MBU2010158.1 hypothetical protein [Patescibacteria group bacterium]
MGVEPPSAIISNIKIKRTTKIPFANDEYYHIYNRGVDKRNIFKDINDLNRFFQSMKEFNRVEPIG